MRVKRIVLTCMVAALYLLCLFDPSLALENVRIAYPSMSSSVLYFLIANKQGYYKEEGLNVEILSIRGEIAIRTALAGEVDFFTNAGSALAAAVRGVPVKIIAVTQDTPSWDLIATPQIKSIAQLHGAIIGIMSPEGSLAVVTKEILRKNGIDPVKDAKLIVMGGDDVRYPALKGNAIQATLMNPTTSIRAQREGLTKLASAGDYVKFIQGGLVTTQEKISKEPAKVSKFVRASLKGLRYFLSKREPSIQYMMEVLRSKDREMVADIYDYESKLMVREGWSDDKILQEFIDDMKKTTKVNREIKVSDVFDFSFIRKANDEFKASGWKP
ncbi:MAG: ABC transporter substrate-binding protein [Deltaproteobacteria bacterium]|nr:MAG: ABC transporter substrate-binding protein [Deltaproteobacteria bacterium]